MKMKSKIADKVLIPKPWPPIELRNLWKSTAQDQYIDQCVQKHSPKWQISKDDNDGNAYDDDDDADEDDGDYTSH